MTQDEIIELARQAGLIATPHIKAFAKLVAAKERDELAKKIEKMPFGDTSNSFAQWVREQA